LDWKWGMGYGSALIDGGLILTLPILIAGLELISKAYFQLQVTENNILNAMRNI